jgi:hypothetical protein
MGWFVEELERRAHPRVRRQLPCRVQVAGRWQTGILRDLSAGGVRVETAGGLPPGATVVVALDSPRGERIVLEGSARRSRQAPHSLAQLVTGETALRLDDPPTGYVRWLEDASRSEA